MIDDRTNDPKPVPLGERWDLDAQGEYGMIPLTAKPLAAFLADLASGAINVPDDFTPEDLVHVAEQEGYFTPACTFDEALEFMVRAIEDEDKHAAFGVAFEALAEEGFSFAEVHELFYSEDEPRDDHGRWTSGGEPAPLLLTKDEQKAKWKEYGKRYRENKKAKAEAAAKAKADVPKPPAETPAAAHTAPEAASPVGPHSDPTDPTQYTKATEYSGKPVLSGKLTQQEDEVPMMSLILSKLPEEHLDGLKSITYLDQVGDKPSTMGRWKWDQRIEVRRGYASGASLRHEVGHNVHIAKLTEAAAEEFRVLSNMGKNCTVSDYGRTNTGEHFAEAYRVMGHPVKEHNLQVKEPKTWAYMNRLLRTPEGKSMLLPKGVRVSNKSGARRYSGVKWKG